VDLSKVNVTFERGDGAVETVLKDTAPCDAGADGWQYSDDRTQIRVCGATCERVKSDGAGTVNIVLGCLTEIVK
jgi:hypothetical protein